MENIEKCECCIGIINDYDNTSMVTLLFCRLKKQFLELVMVGQ